MDNLLSHATPTDELGQRNARVNVDALYFPLGSRTSSDVRGFDYFGIVTPVRRGVTPNLSIRSGCVLLRWLQ